MKAEANTEYDFIFCGAGASACLLLLRMHQMGLLKSKSVLIIDKEEKTQRDKTFCFWADNKEAIVHSLGSIISTSWSSVVLPDNQLVQLKPLRYHHVSSLDLYRRIDELTLQCNWQRLTGTIKRIEPNGATFLVETDGVLAIGKQIFDSRTPIYATPVLGETHIHQSFVGWRIELTDTAFPEAFSFMDFSIDQQDSTQFVYVLPYSERTALIEVTRFGSEKINQAQAEHLLTDYIERNYGKFIKLDEEQGCIPMSNASVMDENISGIVQLGARNYSIKPSTGYAFKRMFQHADDIATMLLQNESPTQLNRSHTDLVNGRYAFYDSLLLDILKRKPHDGKRIFETLFKKNDVHRILTFLDEKTSIQEELSIFATLPLKPFLSALGRKLSSHNSFRPALITVLCALLLLLPPDNQLAQLIATISLVAGLILIGIPHGALDHLLETGRIETQQLPKFVLKYIAIALTMAALWYVAPSLSLILFLLYSSWHFGQADGRQWSLPVLQSFSWGASVLLYILGTHRIETNSILASMSTVEMSFSISAWMLLPWLIWFALKRNTAGMLTTCWLIISSQLPLILAFGMYFIGQHSFTGWKHIKSHLRMSNKDLWLHALPFHIGAWLLLAIFYFAQTLASQHEQYFTWGHFFIFLACLSLPHVLAMQSMYAIFTKVSEKNNRE